MNTILLVSYFALWAVVLLLIFAFVVLAHQFGLLFDRLKPAGARMNNNGPAIGDHAPALTGTDLNGRQFEFGGVTPKPVLVTFLSPNCPACFRVAKVLGSFWKNERKRTDFVIVGVAGTEEESREFVAEHRLEGIPYVLSPNISTAFQILSPPYGLVLDRHGVTKAKGIANNLEQLESLLNAAEIGEPSMESYMDKHGFNDDEDEEEEEQSPVLNPLLGSSK